MRRARTEVQTRNDSYEERQASTSRCSCGVARRVEGQTGDRRITEPHADEGERDA